MSIPHPKPEQISKIKDAATMQTLLPFLEMEIEGLERAVEVKVQQALGAGTLTPDAALAFWQEKIAYKRLLQRFKGRINGAQSVAAGLGPAFDLGFPQN